MKDWLDKGINREIKVLLELDLNNCVFLIIVNCDVCDVF